MSDLFTKASKISAVTKVGVVCVILFFAFIVSIHNQPRQREASKRNSGRTIEHHASIPSPGPSQAPPPSEGHKPLDDNALVEGSKLCTRFLSRHEKQCGIPVHLLAAIASVEAGRYHEALGLKLPWPWTIQADGKKQFYSTKDEAIAAVKGLQAAGDPNIYVGCMQINLQRYPQAFANHEQVFDPRYNVAFVAQLLKANFKKKKSWRRATADYETSTLVRGEEYADMVYDARDHIRKAVAGARAGLPNAALQQPKPRGPDSR
jgi:hypothetical protein